MNAGQDGEGVEVNAKNESCVTAKIAGIESTANTTSAKSTHTSVTSNGSPRGGR